MSKPIRPDEVGEAKGTHIPAAVFDAFNAEIATQFAHGSAIVAQNAVIDRLVRGGMTRGELFDRGWLNIEEAYRSVGWTVSYEKPGFNETGAATFKFTARQG
jgi:hypothetical protein